MPPTAREVEVSRAKSAFISTTVGNGLVTTTKLEPGDVIITVSKPYVLTPDNEAVESSCYQCFSEDASLLRCAGCKTVKYCSKACQAASWKDLHKYECKIFKKIQEEGRGLLPTPVRGLLQVLLRLTKGADPEPEWKKLMNHQDAFAKQKELWGEMTLQAQAAIRYGGFPQSMISVAMGALCSMKVNAFNAVDTTDLTLGLCFDATLARANHSCVPNAFVSFDGRRATLRTLQPLAAGDEVLISYIDTNHPLSLRRQQIQDRYLFTCQCSKCVSNWNVYQSFLNHPCRHANGDIGFVAYEKLESLARQGQNLPTQELVRFDDYVENMLSRLRDVLSTSAENNAAPRELRDLLKIVQRLGDRRFIALEPCGGLLEQLAKQCSDVEDYTTSLIIQMNLAVYADPYQSPEPWSPHRAASLSDLANTLFRIVSTGGLRPDTRGVIPPGLLFSIDPAPSLVAVVLLATYETSICHGPTAKASLLLLDNVKGITEMLKAGVFTDAHARSSGSLEDVRVMLENGIAKDGPGRELARKHLQRLAALADIDLLYRIAEA